MIKKKKQKISISSYKIYPLLLFICTCFMCVGYAVVNSVTLDITGTAIAKEQDGIFITDVKYVSDINADLDNSKIINAYQTILNSSITLSSTDPYSSITYSVTIYNSTNDNYYYDKIDYLTENATYSNEDITFKLEGITNGYLLKAKEYKTFNITFYYKDNILSKNNNLVSYLKLRFNNTVLYKLIEQRYNENDTYIKLYNEPDANYFKNPIYYFNGEVKNNNVSFAGFCWKIVRTTETKGVKIIYNGTLKDGSCDNSGTSTQLLDTKSFNTKSQSLAYVGYMHNTAYTSLSKDMSSQSNIVFGNNFTYSNGMYTLNNTKKITSWSTEYNTINNNHYTCFNSENSCEEIYYVYYTSTSAAYYITLTNGKSVENAIDEMLYSDNVNKNNSTIKEYIDSWYENNLFDYTDKLEDTIFCNDRQMNNKAKNGWNPNGGSTTVGIYFTNASNTYSLKCTNETDSFSLNNPKAKLKYPVGLLSTPEYLLVYKDASNSTFYLRSYSDYWLISPQYYITIYDGIRCVNVDGVMKCNDARVKLGVRPVVSLKTNIEYSSGDGTVANPYIIDK